MISNGFDGTRTTFLLIYTSSSPTFWVILCYHMLNMYKVDGLSVPEKVQPYGANLLQQMSYQ